jgi:hypothetical protein
MVQNARSTKMVPPCATIVLLKPAAATRLGEIRIMVALLIMVVVVGNIVMVQFERNEIVDERKHRQRMGQFSSDYMCSAKKA